MSETSNNVERAVTIGVFDGVHKGHRALLAETVRVANEQGFVPTALTFDPHPSALFSPARTPLLLDSLDTRLSRLRFFGAQETVVAPFDRALAALTPEEFVRIWLIERLNTRVVIVGEDFRFGCDRSGDIAYLKHAGEKYGFQTITMPAVFIDGVPCRSTTIRQMLLGGQVEAARPLLDRPYSLLGKVVHGRKLGRTIGFPTANLELEPGILVPGAGVYSGEAHWVVTTPMDVVGLTFQHAKTIHCRAAISIGTNPTVTPGIDAPRTVEAYLLDFDGDLYDRHINLTFEHFLRGTEKFDSLDALVAQIHRDVAQVRSGKKDSGSNTNQASGIGYP